MLMTLAFALTPAAAPAQELWSTQSLTAPRRGAMVAALGGQILAAGGEDSSPDGLSDRVDIFFEATGTTIAAQLSQPRAMGSANTPPDLAMFAGGVTTVGGVPVPSDRIDAYRLSTGLWTELSLSAPRFHMASACFVNLHVFAGGETDPSSALPVASDVVDLFSHDLLLKSVSLATARTELCAVASNQEGEFGYFFAGGRNGADVYDSVEFMTLSGDFLGGQTPLSQARYDLCSTAVGTATLFAGGTDAGGAVSAVVDIYTNTGGGSWTTASLSEARTGLSATRLGSKAYFFGGQDSSGALSQVVDVYDSATGLWSTIAPLPAGDSQMQAAVSGPRVYLPNGSLGSDQVFVLQAGPTIGQPFCSPAQPNSSGFPARIEAIGNAGAQGQPYEVTLHATSLPSSTFSFFLGGLSTGSQQVGQGILCLGPGFLRIRPSVSFVRGSYSYSVNVSDVDETGAPSPILAGQTWYFQAWHRDFNPAATSNMSDSVEIAFQ